MGRLPRAAFGVVCLLLACVAGAGAEPRLRLSQERWDFGALWHGEKATLKLTITNDGASDLELTSVTANCGCTVPKPSRTRIPPGETAEIEIVYDSKGRQGPVHSQVQIASNDPRQPLRTFDLAGEVKRAITQNPPNGFVFRAIDFKPGLSATIRLENQEPEPMQLKLLSVQPAGFEVDVREVKPGRTYDVTARMTQSFPRGVVRGSVELSTGVQREPHVQLGIYAFNVQKVDLSPPAFLVHRDLSEKSQRRVRIQYYGDQPFAITGVQSSFDKVSVDVGKPQPPSEGFEKLDPRPSSMVTVIFHLPPGHEIPDEGVTVQLHTNDPDYPVLEVYVTNDPAVYRERLRAASAHRR